jgi:serine/threonine-protein kinase
MAGQSSGGGPVRLVGRYAIYGEIAAGGMATVHLGRLVADKGFARTVAIKRLHPHLAKQPDFATMFVDEARLAARVRHPNVVQTLDVVQRDEELLLVMDYVHGESLARLVGQARRQDTMVPLDVASGILCGALAGLHAAHEATNEHREPLGLVHRDVSPHNVLIGTDGVPMVVDFGVAKATGRLTHTRSGFVKGKLAYMAPEQIRRQGVDRRTDVFAAAVVLWELLAGRRLFDGDNDGEIILQVISGDIEPLSRLRADVSAALEEVLMRGLAREPSARWATARAMADALERACPPASPRVIGEWVELVAGDRLRARSEVIADVEAASQRLDISTERWPVSPAPSDPAVSSGEVAPSQLSSITVTRSAQTRVGRRAWPFVLLVPAAAGVLVAWWAGRGEAPIAPVESAIAARSAELASRTVAAAAPPRAIASAAVEATKLAEPPSAPPARPAGARSASAAPRASAPSIFSRK